MKINICFSKSSKKIIEMKTFNVPQFYNGFCCYFKSTCSSFDKVIKLFTLSCLHPNSTWVRTKFKLVGPWVKPPLEYLIKPFAYYILGLRYKTLHAFWIWNSSNCHSLYQLPNAIMTCPLAKSITCLHPMFEVD
jgi:hypothetical protein